MLTDDPLSAGVHIIPLGLLTPDKLKAYSDKWKDSFNKVVGFRPTGWTCVLFAPIF
jgi:DNA cross-link repair 1A protein